MWLDSIISQVGIDNFKVCLFFAYLWCFERYLSFSLSSSLLLLLLLEDELLSLTFDSSSLSVLSERCDSELLSFSDLRNPGFLTLEPELLPLAEDQSFSLSDFSPILSDLPDLLNPGFFTPFESELLLFSEEVSPLPIFVP